MLSVVAPCALQLWRRVAVTSWHTLLCDGKRGPVPARSFRHAWRGSAVCIADRLFEMFGTAALLTLQGINYKPQNLYLFISE